MQYLSAAFAAQDLCAAIEVNETGACEIVLNSRSPNPIDVTPTFYTLSRDAIVGNAVTLQPAEIRFVNVEQLMPDALRGQRRWGGIALSYTGHVLEVWAQITFHGVGGAGSTYVRGTFYEIEWEFFEDENGGNCREHDYASNDSAPVDVAPRIDDITPNQGPIDSSVGISIGGSGFGTNPSVSVGGTGITTNIQDHSEASISVTLNISADAGAGNHSITVTANGKQSNGVNFFVQIPTKLRRDSYGELQDQQGGCGARRSLQYTLLDQEDAQINTNGTIAEGIDNTSGPPGVGCSASPPVQMSQGGFPDIVGYNYSPGCPPPFTATCTQTFVVTLTTAGHAWALSSQNAISMGRTSSGSKFVDINFTQ